MCSGTGSCGETLPRLKGGLFFDFTELSSCDLLMQKYVISVSAESL
jgi:hypothetical protein